MNIIERSLLDNLKRTALAIVDFDPSNPVRVLELTRGASPAAWARVEGLTLTIGRVGDLQPMAAVSLSGKTIGDVSAQVQSLIDGGTLPGFTVTCHQWATESALRIIETRAGGSASGDIYATDCPTWALGKTIALELDEAKVALRQAISQMSVVGAGGIIQDFWGGHFRVSRPQGAGDIEYGHRVVTEIIQAKANNLALENIIALLTGLTCQIYELTYQAPDGTMLLNNVPTPIHDVDFPLWGGTDAMVLPVGFVVRLQGYDEGDLSADELSGLQYIVLRYKQAGTKPYIAYDDATVAL